MTRATSNSAYQRFVMRRRTRARRRALRGRLAVAGVLALALTSCVTRAPQSHLLSVALADPAPDYSGVPMVQPMVAMTTPAPSGPSFIAALGERDRTRATLCLASAIYYEAATEPDEGQRAVAQVILNRVRHPAWPHTVCGVVYQGSSQPGCQFTFACDGAMARAPMVDAWIRARHVAVAALAGEIYAPVGSSTYYHTLKVAPAWDKRMVPTVIVGAHIFYRQPGDGATADTLPFHYAGGEPSPGPLPRIAPPAELLKLLATTTPLPVPAAQPLPAMVAGKLTYVPVAQHEEVGKAPDTLPESTIRPEFRDSGKWIGG